MREHLQPLDGQRLTFTGTFTRFGCRPHFGNVYLETVLLENVTTADGAAFGCRGPRSGGSVRGSP
jgi:hypothetical protein